MKKNMITLVLSLMLVSLPANPVFADTNPVNPIGDYINMYVVIKEAHNENDLLSLNAETEEGGPMVLKINENVIILDGTSAGITDRSELIAGKRIMAAYRSNMPMMLIYPPQITPEVVIIMPEDGNSAKVDYFDKDNLSSDAALQINVSDETKIFDLTGAPVSKEDIYGKPLAVFYTIMTMSLPPQAPPVKIIVLNEEPLGESTEGVPSMPGFTSEQLYEQNGTMYVRLADVAQQFGYDIEWNGEQKSVTLSKGNSSYSITIGEVMYDYNLALGYFNVAPIIVNDRTFVEIEFVSVLLNKIVKE